MVPAASAVGWLLMDQTVSGTDFRPGQRQFHRLGQGFDVVGAVMPLAVDEERRGSRYTGKVSGIDVLGHPGRTRVLAQIGGEPRDVRAERARVPDQVTYGERALVVHQQVVHAPELAL